jgi:hypothetical protein
MLDPQTLKKIEQAVKRFVAYLKYRSIGPHALDQETLKDLVRSGWIGPKTPPSVSIAESYLNTHTQVAKQPAPKSMRDGAIEFLERMHSRYVDKAGEQLKTDLLNDLESNLMPIIDRREGVAIYETLKDRKNHGKYLGNLLNDRVKNWRHRWSMIVQTELNRAANFGSLDAILHNNRDKSPDEIHVYKISRPDACKHCTEFYRNPDGTPRLYKLSEILQNGSNIGKKQADWKPCIDSTHPHCRCMLNEVKPGFGFKDKKLEYIGPEHNEYSAQRKP